MKEWKSFLNAFRGIGVVVKEEPHFRFHLLAVLVVSLFGKWLSISRADWIVVLFCFALVLMAEAFNSSIEALADAVTLEKHPLIKKTKDIAAGAVLIVSILSIIIAALVFAPYFMQ